MEVEVKMNSEVYHDLVQEAVDTAIERTLNTVEKKAQRLNFFTNEEMMKILGYKNKESYPNFLCTKYSSPHLS